MVANFFLSANVYKNCKMVKFGGISPIVCRLFNPFMPLCLCYRSAWKHYVFVCLCVHVHALAKEFSGLLSTFNLSFIFLNVCRQPCKQILC